MSSSSTISPPEAEILHECFISLRDPPEVFPHEDVTTQVFPEESVDQCLEENGINSDYFEELLIQSLIENEELTWCPECGSAAELCDRQSHSYESRTEYRLQPDAIFSKWSSWVEQNTELEIIEDSQRGNTHWKLIAEINSDKIELRVFFSAEDMREYDFNPEQLEFGIGFFDYSILPDEDYLFSWVGPLETTRSEQESFSVRLRSVINTYTESISARFVDTDKVADFHRDIRKGIWKFLEKSGFTPSREITEHLTTHRGRYGIEPKGDDFVAVNNDQEDEVLLVCRCDRGKGSYHLHRFEDEEVKSVESVDEYNYLLESIEDKVDEYISIQKRKQNASSLTNVLAGVTAIVSFSIFVDSFLNIANLISTFLPEGTTVPPELKLALLIGNGLAVILLVSIISKPYYDQIRFNWDIPRE